VLGLLAFAVFVDLFGDGGDVFRLCPATNRERESIEATRVVISGRSSSVPPWKDQSACSREESTPSMKAESKRQHTGMRQLQPGK
jgi:hypothetical protein